MDIRRDENGRFMKGAESWIAGKKGIHQSPKTEFKKGHKMSNEVRTKISETMKGRASGMKDKQHSEETKLKMSKAHGGKKKSKKHIQNLSGEKHWNWRGGVTSENEKIRKSPKWKPWRMSVFARDGHICQNISCSYCNNKPGGFLHPHHIEPLALRPDLAYDVSNGITYCKEYHIHGGLHKDILQKKYASQMFWAVTPDGFCDATNPTILADVDGNVFGGGLQILDGKGKGILAGVDSEGQLQTVAENHELQHHLSLHDGQVYQAIGTHDATAAGAGTYTTLHIRNTSTTQWLIVTFIRLQAHMTGGAVAAQTDFFDIGFDRTYSSGGSTVAPVNTNRTSGNTAATVVYNANPTLVGTMTLLDRWYIEHSSAVVSNSKMQVFNKQGSVILGQNNTLEITATTSQNAFLYSRVTFMFKHPPV